MRRQPSGPRRARSVRSYLRQTRVAAGLALAALVAGVVSDVVNREFWQRHALLAGLVSSGVVVVLTVAVINEVLERRQRQRWSVLAQYVMFQLVRNARMIWSSVLEVAGVDPIEPGHPESVDAARHVVRDTSRLTAAVGAAAADEPGRARLHSEFAFLAEHSDDVLGRWAGVMLNARIYAEVIDRHVELAGDVGWIADLLDNADPPTDPRRQRRARSNPATRIWGDVGGGWLADRVVVIAQLAEELDSGTLELALRLVPVQWWEERLATADPR